MTARIMLLPFCATGPVSNPKRWKSKAPNVISLRKIEARKSREESANRPHSLRHDSLNQATDSLSKALADLESTHSDEHRQRVAVETINVMFKLRESFEI